MDDASTPMDAATRAALEKLADIVVPPPVAWTPQTWGWAALAVLLAALAGWALWRRHRRRIANRYRTEALAELAKLEAMLDDAASRALALEAMPPLVKRVALAAWPRAEVASLSGGPWVAFLRERGGAPMPDAAARLLDDVEYRSLASLRETSAADAKACAAAVRGWIEGHRVPA